MGPRGSQSRPAPPEDPLDQVGSPPYAILMAGQFSETPEMGCTLSGDSVFLDAARAFGALTGGKFPEWVTRSGADELGRHEVACEAVVLFDAALGEVARARFGAPGLVAGYSLGFYAAASLAGVFPMELALAWIRRVNAGMEARFPGGSFGLAVSIGLSRGELLDTFGAAGLRGLRIANVNNARQLVYAGPSAEVSASMRVLEGKVLSAKELPLGFPLHTPYLEPVVREVEPWWRTVELADPSLPLLSPVDGSILSRSEAVREAMLLSLTEPTDWVAVVRAVASASPEWALDTSGDGSLGRMTRWVDRGINMVPYREAFGVAGAP